MALVIETGTGRADAESLCSVTAADSYHSLRGNTSWAGMTTDAKEQALRKATDYMQQAYAGRWAGYKFSITQALDWPRVQVPVKDSQGIYSGGLQYYPNNTIPREVANACAEFALRSVATPLAPDESPAAIRKTVGPLTVEYAQGTRQTTKFSAVDMLLSPFLSNGSGTFRVVRS